MIGRRVVRRPRARRAGQRPPASAEQRGGLDARLPGRLARRGPSVIGRSDVPLVGPGVGDVRRGLDSIRTRAADRAQAASSRAGWSGAADRSDRSPGFDLDCAQGCGEARVARPRHGRGSATGVAPGQSPTAPGARRRAPAACACAMSALLNRRSSTTSAPVRRTARHPRNSTPRACGQGPGAVRRVLLPSRRAARRYADRLAVDLPDRPRAPSARTRNRGRARRRERARLVAGDVDADQRGVDAAGAVR